MNEIPEELRRLIENQIKEYNKTAQKDFEGFSPEAMRLLIYAPFEDACALKFNFLDEEVLNQSPLFRQVYYLASLINEMKVVKLTAKGYLPLKIVTDIRNRKLLIDNKQYMHDYKDVYREQECYGILLSRLLLRMCGFTKRSSKQLELTAKGKKMLADKPGFLRILFETYTTKFNWAYADGYSSDLAGQFAWAFSMCLIAKYGDVPRSSEFYSGKYFNAFPIIADDFRYTAPSTGNRCYTVRMLSRFLEYMGLIDITYPKDFLQSPTLVKTSLFDKFARVIK